MASQWPGTLVLAGAGKMGGALLRGWLAGGLDPAAVRVVDPYLDAATTEGWQRRGVTVETVFAAPPSPKTDADVLVLAMKPQTFAETPAFYAPLAGPDTLVVSILAGKTIATLRTALPKAGAIARAMPNLPAGIGRGASGVAGEPGKLSPKQKDIATTLLESVGLVEWLDESLIDAVTAVSGSGPAYVFYLTECLAEAGFKAGLPAEVARQLARATVEGAAALSSQTPGRSIASLREAVTSPGGTTAAALDVLRAADGLEPLMTKAVAAAKKRAGDLSG